ncbi:hypothetical protein L593_08125 [Salinarchaeum sp. Harcht-Bsk1]|uniref:hypothetical protein n=1 Tax=Salinarchaeum sp. Harcht-Bsk1 TaxID=1333523 RepID=UPI00034246DC|nr:hypothetical protein [Salinarchaeum sp. Harcht-Bsk1]AGN01570.1 hypothetical protein L593_08125 [Salinarchaeum sp. Harcht-Bsk1]
MGGLLSLGGVSVLGGTQAFSQTDATRGTAVQTAGDRNALLGVDPVASVQTGTDGQDLVTLTNNIDAVLDVTISLDDPSQGSVSPSTATIASGASTTITVDVAADSPTGTDALPFTVSATDGGDFSVSLTRTVDVEAGPQLLRHVADQSRNNTAQYTVQFDVNGVSDFDRVEVSFVSRDNNWASGSSTATTPEGSVSYSEGGAMGDTYDITIDVYDTSGSIVLSETVTDVADGSNPSGNDDLGGPNSPELDSFSLQDTTRRNSTDFDLDYEVSNLTNFQEVRVTFENRDNSWATDTKTDTSAPTGSVSYSAGGTQGDTYEITVAVVNDSGITVDSGSITHVSGSSSSASWP